MYIPLVLLINFPLRLSFTVHPVLSTSQSKLNPGKIVNGVGGASTIVSLGIIFTDVGKGGNSSIASGTNHIIIS